MLPVNYSLFERIYKWAQNPNPASIWNLNNKRQGNRSASTKSNSGTINLSLSNQQLCQHNTSRSQPRTNHQKLATMAQERTNTLPNRRSGIARQGNKECSNGSILDKILEKTTNLEESFVKRDFLTTLNEAFRDFAKSERSLRESTISIKINDIYDHAAIVEYIDTEWTKKHNQISATYWRDQTYTYCQFLSASVKNSFLDMLTLDDGHPIKYMIGKPNKEGLHYTRKPVRIEIQGVREGIMADRILNSIRISVESKHLNCLISEIREGKANPANKSRSLMLNVDADGFRHLFLTLGCKVPYLSLTSAIRARLTIKINCRPWVCKACSSIGRHDCPGSLCRQCGKKDHTADNCRAETSFCPRCSKPGHRASNLMCPTYMFHLLKEVRKFDIPLEFYEEEELRSQLIKSLILK